MDITLGVMGKACPLCRADNAADATLCAACGQPFVNLLPAPLITEPVPDDLVQPDAPRGLEASSLDPDIVALMVAGHQEPVLVKGSRSIVLGRYSPGEAAPTVDLTPFDAGVLGVSRQHARIVRDRQGLAVEDLSSTNGTRVNKVRLEPHAPFRLRSGDMVQLGQLVIYVYFNAGDTAEETITLKYTAAGAFRFTPQFLAARVSPFLSALAGIQAVCDEAQARKPGDIDISLISSDAQNALISVRLDRAADAVRLAKGVLAAWRSANADDIARFLALSGSVQKTTRLDADAAAPAQTQLASDAAQARALAHELRASAQAVALAYLAELAPERPAADLKDDAEKLMAHLNVLAFSSLYIASDL